MHSANDANLPYAVTSEDAIGDLPSIDGDLVKRGIRRPGSETYRIYRAVNKLSGFARDMRSWPGFEACEGIEDHLIRCLPRDGYIFAAMPEGAQYPEAHKIALERFEARAVVEGIRRNSEEWETLKKKMVPPYRTDTFPNRWWKLIRNQPSRTLMAHLGKDCYSHIHYDELQKRTISVREAARLQSFPDGFKFSGTMNQMFRQIDNAVPPLLSLSFAESIFGELRITSDKYASQRLSVI